MHAMTKPAPPSTPNKHAALVAQACRRIEAAEQPPSLDDLARQAGLSPFHFHRVFKAATGLTPKAYADAHRANTVRASLARGSSSVTEAIFDAGFNANSRFYEHADAMLGMKPTQYRAGGVDARIEFAIGESSWARSWSPAASVASVRFRWETMPISCYANCRIASRARNWSAATPASNDWLRRSSA